MVIWEDCNWISALADGASFGLVAYLVHGSVFEWLFRRMGLPNFVGLIFSIIPMGSAAVWGASLTCLESVTILSVIFLIAYFMQFAALGFFLLEYINGTDHVATLLSGALCFPFFNVVFALLWIALSWNRPLLVGVHRREKRDRATTLKNLFSSALWTIGTIGLLIAIIYFQADNK